MSYSLYESFKSELKENLMDAFKAEYLEDIPQRDLPDAIMIAFETALRIVERTLEHIKPEEDES